MSVPAVAAVVATAAARPISATSPAFETLSVGDALPPLDLHITRTQLVRFAGVSGDLNQIHWNDRVAAEVGLPGVIAHGMLTMALAARIVTDWADPAALREYGVRFTRPIIVPDDGIGALLQVTAVIGALDADARTARIDITATFEGRTVMGKSRAVVTLA